MRSRPCFDSVDRTLRNTAKSCACRAKWNPPQNLHVTLHHAQVMLVWVVREGHPGLVGELQHLGLAVPQPRRQVLSREQLFAPLPTRPGPRVEFHRLIEPLAVVPRDPLRQR